MREVGSKSLTALGFLTILEHEPLGLIGGYLLLNASGRPLEFHCTAPVKPNRAQQILFGPTLAPYLYGEQIGQTLLAKGATQPNFVCTDVEPALCVREFVAQPVVLVTLAPHIDASMETSSASPIWRLDAAHQRPAGRAEFHWGANKLATAVGHADDEPNVRECLRQLADFDLSEPFGRIREAIEEAHRGTRKPDAEAAQ